MEKGDNTSEIRCKEEAKGGVKYDVIIAEAASPPPVKFVQSPTRVMTSDDIVEKLKAAEERRLSLEAKRTACIGEYIEKVDMILKKKSLKEAEEKTKIKQKVTEKMESHHVRRNAILNEIKSKLKEQEDMVIKANESIKQYENNLRESIMKDLENATIRRQESMKKTVENIRNSTARQRALRRSLDEKRIHMLSELGKNEETESEDRVEAIRQTKKISDGEEVKGENENGEVSVGVDSKKE